MRYVVETTGAAEFGVLPGSILAALFLAGAAEALPGEGMCVKPRRERDQWCTHGSFGLMEAVREPRPPGMSGAAGRSLCGARTATMCRPHQ